MLKELLSGSKFQVHKDKERKLSIVIHNYLLFRGHTVIY